MSENDLVTEGQVLDLVRRSMEQLHVDMAQGIAHALRLYTPRRELPEGGLSLQYGRVENVYPGYCDVLIDTDVVASPIPSLVAPAVGDRVAVLGVPPSSGLIIASGTGGGGSTPGGLGASSGLIALWELPGPVIPVAVEDSANIPIVASATINGVTLSLDEAPATGLTCVVDVFLNGVTLYTGTKPTLAATETLGYFPFATPVATTASLDILSAAVITPAGRTLTIAVS